MKTLILSLGIMIAMALAPAYARLKCYTYNGEMICCSTVGNTTACF